MALDLKKLSRLDWGILGAAVVGFVALFLPWYGVSSGLFSASVSGWSTSYGWLGGLLIIASGAYLALHRAEFDLSKVPVGLAVVVLGTSVLGTFIVIIQWLTLPKGSGAINGVTVYNYGPRVGIIIALVVGVIQVVCAFLLFRASSEPVPWANPDASTPGSTTGLRRPSTARRRACARDPGRGAHPGAPGYLLPSLFARRRRRRVLPPIGDCLGSAPASCGVANRAKDEVTR